VYKWNEGLRKSVGVDLSVQMPQFSVRGYRAKNKLEVLSTGMIGRDVVLGTRTCTRTCHVELQVLIQVHRVD